MGVSRPSLECKQPPTLLQHPIENQQSGIGLPPVHRESLLCRCTIHLHLVEELKGAQLHVRRSRCIRHPQLESRDEVGVEPPEGGGG